MPTFKDTPGHSYTRFIPKEELGVFAAWNPSSLEDPEHPRSAPGQSPAGGGVYKAPFSVRAGVDGAQTDAPQKTSNKAPNKVAGQAPGPAGYAGQAAPTQPTPPESPRPPTPEVEAQIKESRQAGYHDGYRDGLAAMESFKQTQAAQMAAFMSDHMGTLVSDMHHRLDSVEQQLSGRIAGVALELARQVVRSEIALRPELVVAVAEEALNTLLDSARHVTLRLHPEDHALAHGLLEEQLAARGARTVSDPHVTHGGCLVESDIAVVDASVEARWHKVAAAMGMRLEWGDRVKTTVPRSVEISEGDSQWLDDMDEADAHKGARS